MSAPLLPARSSIPFLRQEVVFTRARLAARGNTKALAPAWVKFLKRVAEVDAQQNDVWDAETIADALVVAADTDLDDFIARFFRAVEEVAGGKKSHPAYALYFSVPAYKLAAPVLGDELSAMHGWLRLAAKEKNDKLKTLLGELAPLVQAGDEAVTARDDAATTATAFRTTGGYADLVKEITTLRDATARSLEEIAESAGLGRGFARSFFRARPHKASEAEKAEKAAAREAEKKRKEEQKKALKDARDQVKAAIAGLKKVKDQG